MREFTDGDKFKLADAQRVIIALERNMAQAQAQFLQHQLNLNVAKGNYDTVKNKILSETGGLIIDETLEWQNGEHKTVDKV